MADGPAGFTQDFSCPALLRMPLRFAWLRVRAFHPLRSDFPDASARHVSCDTAVLQPPRGRNRAGLGSSPFARHYWGNHSYFLFLRVLRCFSSPRSPPPCGGWQAFSLPGCPIRRSADQGSFAPPRGFSQLIASFVACKSLGIHRAPFLTSCRRTKRPKKGGREAGMPQEGLSPSDVFFCLYRSSFLYVSIRSWNVFLTYVCVCIMSYSASPKRDMWRITDSNR